MTTMELIERGIGHNCLSDAYDLGRADTINDFIEMFWKSEIEFRPSQIDEILRIAEKLKEQNND